jgi:hypothetical protein
MKHLLTVLILAASLIAGAQAPDDKPLADSPVLSAILNGDLQRIQAGPYDELQDAVYNMANIWATAGFIGQASRLLNDFWHYKTVAPGELHYHHEGFMLLWALSGVHPDSIPFPLETVDDIVQKNWDNLFAVLELGRYPQQEMIEQTEWHQLPDSLLFLKGSLLSYDAHGEGRRASRDNRLEAIKAFGRYLSSGKRQGFDLFQATTCATLVAASVGDSAATGFLRQWGNGYLEYPNSYILDALQGDTATAHMLLSGVIAGVWGLTAADCDRGLAQAEAALSRRITKGPSLIHAQWSFKTLLQQLSDKALASGDLEYDRKATTHHWLGYAPATPAAITAAEKRLGVTFPRVYREFLLLSNGFRASGYVDPELLPVEKIGWARDLDPDLKMEWDGSQGFRGDSAMGLRRSILIGGLQDEEHILLVPPDKKGGSWQCWTFDYELGVRAYPDLRYYLEGRLEL